jgi:hypothetical protein
MPLLDIKQTRKVTAICSLEESTAIQVDQYAAFVKCLPDEVVNKALEYTFGKDADFQKFRSSAPRVPAQLRIKKPAKVPTGARPGPKPSGLAAAD